nr:hypothetical protein CoNPh38_CDS0297 [Staphylococcus phage S-CoN_Ph38]
MIKKKLNDHQQEQICFDLSNALGFAGARVKETNIYWGNTRPAETVETMLVIIKPHNYTVQLFDKRKILRQHPHKGTHKARLKGGDIHIHTRANGYKQHLILRNGQIIHNY